MSSWGCELMFARSLSVVLSVGIIIACCVGHSVAAKTNLSSESRAAKALPAQQKELPLPDSCLLEAQSLAQNGKLAEARKLTQSYLKKAPKSLEAVAFLGTIDEALGNYAEARESYKRLLTLAPDVWQARLGLARTNLKLSEYRAGVDELTKLSQEHPDEAKVWLNLSLAKLETGDLDDAEDAAKKAILFDPSSLAPVKLLAEIKFQSSQVRYARELALAILKREPKNSENYKFLLKCMAFTRVVPEELNDVIDIAQDNGVSSKLLYELGRQGELHALAIKPGNSLKLTRRKNAWYLVSARAFDLACRADEKNARYHIELARVLAVLKMKQAALVEADKASRIDPNIKYGKQLDAAVAAAKRDIAGRIKVCLSGQGI